MGRRVRHLNPAHAGAVIALDSRFVTGLASNDPLGTWASRRPATVDATASDTVRPLWTTGRQGGQPGVVFDGSNDVLATTTTIDAEPRTFLVTAKRDAAASSNRSVLGNRVSSAGLIMRTTSTSLLYARISNVSNTYTFSTAGTPLVWTVTDETASNGMVQRANGVQNSTTGSPTDYLPTGAGMSVGAAGAAAGEYFNGDIFSVCVWDSLLSPAQVRRIEQAQAFSFRINIS